MLRPFFFFLRLLPVIAEAGVRCFQSLAIPSLSISS
jgi:hypothetical protein